MLRKLARLPKRLALELLRRTDSVRYARLIGVEVGSDCKLLSTNFGSEPYLVTIGDRVEVTNNVTFITHDGGVWVFRDQVPDIDVFGPIVLRNHCFIGSGAILLPGVTVGERAVVAAGAVVTKDVPPRSVVAGCPARVISDLDAYRQRCEASGVPTKNLSAAEKRKYLLEKSGRG